MNFFDLHCDTATECYRMNTDLNCDTLAVTYKAEKKFDKWCQTFAIFVNDVVKNPFEYYKTVFSFFRKKLKDDINAVFTIENSKVIEKDISRLELLKSQGIKAITLTWNQENYVASGVDAVGGLKPFGREVIREMNNLKIACDLSHLNEKSFFDSLKVADYPYASHSCCKYICDHKRNLSDTQLKEIAEKGGLIGICLYPEFLGSNNVFEQVYRNICHLLHLGLENNISIGTDFDGASMSPWLSKITQIPDLRDFLERKGLRSQLLEKIFFENAINFFLRL